MWIYVIQKVAVIKQTYFSFFFDALFLFLGSLELLSEARFTPYPLFFFYGDRGQCLMEYDSNRRRLLNPLD